MDSAAAAAGNPSPGECPTNPVCMVGSYEYTKNEKKFGLVTRFQKRQTEVLEGVCFLNCYNSTTSLVEDPDLQFPTAADQSLWSVIHSSHIKQADPPEAEDPLKLVSPLQCHSQR